MENIKRKVLAIIPARGGSKGIPRKNIRHLNGKPLISYTISTALSSNFISKVVVSTDDEEIAAIARNYGANIIFRPDHLSSDEVPLDPVIFDAVQQLEHDGEEFNIVVTIQPTSPLLRKGTLDCIIKKIVNEQHDTVLTAVDDRHLSWTKIEDSYEPKYIERRNRQYLPSEYRETGAIMASKRSVITAHNRIGERVSLYEVDENESIDIDSMMDWWVAEKLLKKKRVLIRVDGHEKIGLGHVYRSLTLANNIMDHELIFLMDEQYQLGIELVKSQNFKVVTFTENPYPIIVKLKPDIIINDILDTSKDYIFSLKDLGLKVFNFEDLGSGAEYADGVFNALYPGTVPRGNFYTGEKYYCAKNEFLNLKSKEISAEVRNVLITYGGTDPSGLTLKTLRAITRSSQDFNISVILGPGYSNEGNLRMYIKEIDKEVNIYRSVKNMADHMRDADIIFSSAGRTMYEIAMVGTPAIIIAQNFREMTHLFGHNYNGFVNLGIHLENSEERILETLERVIEDVELRKIMNKRMVDHDLSRGLERVLKVIFDN